MFQHIASGLNLVRHSSTIRHVCVFGNLQIFLLACWSTSLLSTVILLTPSSTINQYLLINPSLPPCCSILPPAYETLVCVWLISLHIMISTYDIANHRCSRFSCVLGQHQFSLSTHEWVVCVSWLSWMALWQL